MNHSDIFHQKYVFISYNNNIVKYFIKILIFSYLCILIVEYIRLIELYWKSKNTLKTTDKKIQKINRSILINGIYNHLLKLIIKGELNESSLQKFILSYIEIHTNLKDRHFPRTSKRPFSKWYATHIMN